MMKEEFEKLAGYEVSWDDYNNIIEPMYMATKLNKADFVETINKKRFALRPAKSIVREMKAISKELYETCTHYTDYEKREKLEELAHQYIERNGWKGIAGAMVNYEMRMTCYYPTSVSIYGFNDYKTFEEIKLA